MIKLNRFAWDKKNRILQLFYYWDFLSLIIMTYKEMKAIKLYAVYYYG